MPFKSEAQRRYLWANEPEIARDWADTYGSRIQAALGGIMASRVGLRGGGGGQIGGTADMSGGSNNNNNTGSGGGGGNNHPTMADITGAGPSAEALFGADNRLAYQEDRFKNVPQTTRDKLSNYRDVMQKSLQPGLNPLVKMGLGTIVPFGGQIAEHFYNKNYDPFGYSKAPTPFSPNGGGDGPQQEYPPWWYDNAYAQNVVEDKELDIDTSTGNMEDWSQRFRVDDQYRQDKEGQLDPKIIEMISKLYT